MNILQINKFFHLRGGATRYFFEVSKLLATHEHVIGFFSTVHQKNVISKWSKYFVSDVSWRQNYIFGVLKILERLIYSKEVQKKISNLLSEHVFDVAHLHSLYYQLSPSINIELCRRNIPIIQTLHDYDLISLNYDMFHNREVCEITKKTNYHKAILHKCVKNSYIFSLIAVIFKYYDYLLGWKRELVDFFITPSLFLKDKLIEYDYPVNKIIHLPHFIDTKNYEAKYIPGNYILYFGRLSEEKGLDFLLRVVQLLPQVKLIITGIGNEEVQLKILTNKLRLNNVEFTGYCQEKKLQKIIKESKFTILPSLWYEVFGFSILESFASGKPVVASEIGGIPEIVKDGYNGFLFEPGNVEDCIDKINKLWNNTALCRKMGRNARMYVEKNFGPGEHYERLSAIYQKAISKHK